MLICFFSSDVSAVPPCRLQPFSAPNPCQFNSATDQDKSLALAGNDRSMIRQICPIKPENVTTVRSSELLAKLEDLDLILRERRLRWFGHVERSSGAVRTACDIQVDGRRGLGRPK